MNNCANKAKDLRGNFSCNATQYKKCKGVDCPFYITEAQVKSGRAAASMRLNSLPPEEQEIISDKYYCGQMPWVPQPTDALR